MTTAKSPSFAIRLERARQTTRLVASDAQSQLRIEAHLGPGGAWFEVTSQTSKRTFSCETVLRHPGLSAVLGLIQAEVDAPRSPNDSLLPLLVASLHLYAARLSGAAQPPRLVPKQNDPQVERALALLGEQLASPWTVARLAKAVGLSRPVLARRFLQELGLSPMRYLTQRRMQSAAALLVASDASLAEVAQRVGYRSEFAFNRAFKRHFHVPPGSYRAQPAPTLQLVRCAA